MHEASPGVWCPVEGLNGCVLEEEDSKAGKEEEVVGTSQEGGERENRELT